MVIIGSSWKRNPWQSNVNPTKFCWLFFSLLQLSHSSPTLAWKHSFEICAHSARRPHLRFTHGVACSLFAQDTCASRIGIRRMITMIYWLWNALVFYPREVLHALYRPHCHQVKILHICKCSHFHIKTVHIRCERSICAHWWDYRLEAWMSPLLLLANFSKKKEKLVVLTLFGLSESGSSKLSIDTQSKIPQDIMDDPRYTQGYPWTPPSTVTPPQN